MAMPAHTDAVASAAASHSARHGSGVSLRAAAAGAARRPKSSSAPTIWLASAAVAPTRARNSAPRARTGTPAAAATAESMLAYSSGRAMVDMATTRTAATATVAHMAEVLIPKMLPNRTLTLAVPLEVEPWVV